MCQSLKKFLIFCCDQLSSQYDSYYVYKWNILVSVPRQNNTSISKKKKKKAKILNKFLSYDLRP